MTPKALQEAWDASPTLPPIIFAVDEANALLAALSPHSPKGGLGWDADGLCDDHNRFGCKECALSQTPPAPSLPTDVQSAATGVHEHEVSLKVAMPAPGEVEYIDRGKLKQATDDLIVAVRSSWGIGSAEHNLVRDICDLIACVPGVSLATVAAGDDEGVRDTLETVLSLLTPPGNTWRGDEPAWQAEAYALIRAAIRLLSQGEGK
jgi:hypothetical protein